MDKLLKSGKIWPYAISLAITFIFGAAIVTIMVSVKLPVEKSDTYMMGYHEADAKANELIQARISFDKKYKLTYISSPIDEKNTVLKYKVTTLNEKAVNDAELKAVITRPNSRKFDMELLNPKVQNGIYTFDGVKLPLVGRWNIMVKATVSNETRYLNIKADTRKEEVKEF